jgi:hypothetical protein
MIPQIEDSLDATRAPVIPRAHPHEMNSSAAHLRTTRVPLIGHTHESTANEVRILQCIPLLLQCPSHYQFDMGGISKCIKFYSVTKLKLN